MQSAISKHLTIRNRITWKRDKGRGARRNWKNNMEDVWYATKGEKFTFNLVKWKKPVIAPYRKNGKPKDWVEVDGEKFRWTHPSNIWTDLCVPFWSMPENTPHPTQKPEKLVARIVEASSRPGDLVLDPFTGSGTTAVVCKALRRRCLGFEINPDYVRLAMKRLDS
jgi:site-specific DNA-methyltransferase (adenine-specific)